jgi:hypothetical protein
LALKSSPACAVHDSKPKPETQNPKPETRKPKEIVQRDTSIPVFIALNFTLAGLSVLWLAFWACVLVFGVMMSNDPPEEVMYGVLGSVMLASPALIGVFLYTFAGYGMVKRRRWAYYVHLVGACVAGLSCIGLAYTIPAIMIAQRPSFRGEFFPEEAAATSYGFDPVMLAQQQQQQYYGQQQQQQYPPQSWR